MRGQKPASPGRYAQQTFRQTAGVCHSGGRRDRREAVSTVHRQRPTRLGRWRPSLGAPAGVQDRRVAAPAELLADLRQALHRCARARGTSRSAGPREPRFLARRDEFLARDAEGRARHVLNGVDRHVPASRPRGAAGTDRRAPPSRALRRRRDRSARRRRRRGSARPRAFAGWCVTRRRSPRGRPRSAAAARRARRACAAPPAAWPGRAARSRRRARPRSDRADAPRASAGHAARGRR